MNTLNVYSQIWSFVVLSLPSEHLDCGSGVYAQAQKMGFDDNSSFYLADSYMTVRIALAEVHDNVLELP